MKPDTVPVHRRIHLDEVCILLTAGRDLDDICRALDVTRDALTQTVRRRGNQAQAARIARASRELADRKRQAAHAAMRTSRHTTGTRLKETS